MHPVRICRVVEHDDAVMMMSEWSWFLMPGMLGLCIGAPLVRNFS